MEYTIHSTCTPREQPLHNHSTPLGIHTERERERARDRVSPLARNHDSQCDAINFPELIRLLYSPTPTLSLSTRPRKIAAAINGGWLASGARAHTHILASRAIYCARTRMNSVFRPHRSLCGSFVCVRCDLSCARFLSRV